MKASKQISESLPIMILLTLSGGTLAGLLFFDKKRRYKA